MENLSRKAGIASLPGVAKEIVVKYRKDVDDLIDNPFMTRMQFQLVCGNLADEAIHKAMWLKQNVPAKQYYRTAGSYQIAIDIITMLDFDISEKCKSGLDEFRHMGVDSPKPPWRTRAAGGKLPDLERVGKAVVAATRVAVPDKPSQDWAAKRLEVAGKKKPTAGVVRTRPPWGEALGLQECCATPPVIPDVRQNVPYGTTSFADHLVAQEDMSSGRIDWFAHRRRKVIVSSANGPTS